MEDPVVIPVAGQVKVKMDPLVQTLPVAPVQPSLPPTTTYQEDIVLAGQRKVNLIWEYTQAFIAIITVIGNVIVAGYFAIARLPANEYPLVLSSCLFLVVGSYFQRTNHQRIGGLGPKSTDNQKYEGR